MRKFLFTSTILVSTIISCNKSNDTDYTYSISKKPNILLIVVDDMGMADLGSFGGEIDTPNLDTLAYQGIRLTNFHASPVCSVTRAMLLTGVDAHKAGFGNMAEELAPNQTGMPGHEGALNSRVVTIASLLQDNGYHTYISGKWHLGETQESAPTSRGFDKSFVLLAGGASHYADMKPAYSPDPNGLAPYRANGTRVTELPKNFRYSSQFYVDQLISFIDSNNEDEPFFGYLAFTAPHWPLQAPDSTVQKYKGKYDSGFDNLRRQRLKRQKELGILPASIDENMAPPKSEKWTSLSAERQQIEAKAMEIYAAMIDQVDLHTGRLLQHLTAKNLLDNTVIIFISDNGAEGHDIDETWPADIFPEIRTNINERHDFSFENMGKPDSYVFYGPNWARAGAPGFRLHKGFPTEGGTRVSAFVHYPGFVQQKISDRFFTVLDIAPTILQLAGIEHPAPTYKGRDVENMIGIPMVGALRNETLLTQKVDRIHAGEVMGKYFVRKGPWKMVYMPFPAGTGDWQLYNLDTDIGERHDLSIQMPEMRSLLIQEWQDYVKENGVILPDWVSGY